MFNFVEFLSVLTIVNSAFAVYSGPYLLWGVNRLEHLQLPALEAVDKRTLTSIYSEAKAVVMFIRNSTSRLDQNQFPNFKDLIAKNKWIYLPQNSLPADPTDYNSNVDIIFLVGPPSQQDVELSALYKDAQTIYGQGEVLGILANQPEDGHFIYKRDTGEKDTPQEEASSTSTTTTEEPPKEQLTVENSIYQQTNGLLYTSSPPELVLEENGLEVKKLKTHGDITEDLRPSKAYRLNVRFKNLVLSFRFNMSKAYWTLNDVELGGLKNGSKLIMSVEGDLPSAPLGFSYNCPRELVFRNNTNYLKLKNIQVQPFLADKQKAFSDAYDCIGFMTVPIWSGIFVSSIILFGTFVGIIALMDIKTPNRFESNRNKQLTFTIQE